MFSLIPFKSKVQNKEYKHEYECDFYISRLEDITIEEIVSDKKYYEVDNMFNHVIGEDRDDGFLQQLLSNIVWYSIKDSNKNNESIDNFNKERIKRINEDSEWEFNGLKIIRKYVLNKKLKAEKTYAIQTNKDGNFLKIDKEYVYDITIFSSGQYSQEDCNNDDIFTKEIRQAIDKLIDKFVREYNIVTNEIFKKLKKIK